MQARAEHFKKLKGYRDLMDQRYKVGDRFTLRYSGGVCPYPNRVLVYLGSSERKGKWFGSFHFEERTPATFSKNGRPRIYQRDPRWFLDYGNDPIPKESTNE